MLLLLSLAITTLAYAFRLEPMVLSLPVTQPRAAGTYTVENNSDKKVAVEFKVRGRQIDREGKEERPEAKGFLVYPQQMALEPGEKRSVRVTWAGEKTPSAELAFRLVASQLPVKFEGEKSGNASIRFLLEYVASLYLVPNGVKAAPKVLEQRVKEKRMEILVANAGTAHHLLETMTIELSDGKKSAAPAKEVLAELRTGNLLAGEERWLRLPLPAGFGPGTKARVQFGP